MQLEVFGCVVVGQADGFGLIRRDVEFAVAPPGLFGNLARGQYGQLAFDLLEHGVCEGLVETHAKLATGGIMLRLAKQVAGDQGRISVAIGDDSDLGGTG